MNQSRRQRIGLREHGRRRVQRVTTWSAMTAAAASVVFGVVLAGGTAQADPPAQSPSPTPSDLPSPPGAGTSPGFAPLDPGPETLDPSSTGGLVPPSTSPRSTRSSRSGSSGSSGSGSGSGSHVHVRSGGS